MVPLLLFFVPFVTAAHFVPRQQGNGLDVWGGYNITDEVLGVAAAISSPVCNATANCTIFVTQTIPTCERLGDNPGCWCSNPDPLHYCALCMSSPTDNTTTPEQTQDALTHHANYHKGCAAYQAAYNASLSSSSAAPSSTSTSSSASATPTLIPVTSSNSKTNIGPIVGGAVGGFVALVVILAILFIIYKHIQNKHVEALEGTVGRSSMFSGGGLGGEVGHASKFEVDTPMAATPGVGPGPGGSAAVVAGGVPRANSASSGRTPPPLNQYAVPSLGPRMMNPDPDHMSEFRGPGMGNLSPAPMYQPQPQPPPPHWRESLASSGTYNTSTGSRYDNSMGQHSQTSPTGLMQPSAYRNPNDVIPGR
ncbi:hypothetical protein FRB93_009347 [Tulasnella sp. JGI-2019a]|nr:hypothetical protein FRB93_009347 [Tulasnella sp. JGI-2019a]